MRARTTEGKRLKRLAKEYADAWADLSWIGGADPRDHNAIRKAYKKAREKLHKAIDEVTSLDLTPRVVEDS